MMRNKLGNNRKGNFLFFQLSVLKIRYQIVPFFLIKFPMQIFI